MPEAPEEIPRAMAARRRRRARRRIRDLLPLRDS
jgi:hypothetical protein